MITRVSIMVSRRLANGFRLINRLADERLSEQVIMYLGS